MSDRVSHDGAPCSAACCPSTQRWREQRLIYLRVDAAGSLVQPSAATPILTARAPGDDPGMAVVSLHAIASVREIGVPQVTPSEAEIRTAAQGIPVAETVIPAIGDPVGPQNTGRGPASPQYRVTFVDGSTDGAVAYADGGSLLAHPASTVTVEAITPPLSWNGQGAPPATVGPGLVVDAIAAASVAWGDREGSAAPQGMATYTQVAEGGGAGALLMLFERPPFARRVQVTLPIAVGAFYEFRSSPTFVIETPPPLANAIQRQQDVPGDATHVAVHLAPTAPAGTRATVVWELGVR